MNDTKTVLSSFGLFALWFGAAISLAEIFTGGLLAPLGFQEGVIAILVGHLIGGVILILGGFIGAHANLPAMLSTRISFGRYGSHLFSLLNALQLVGWTAVMIISGAKSANELGLSLWGMDNVTLWAIVMGGMIFTWIYLGKKGFQKLNVLAVVLLFVLTCVLCGVVFQKSEIFTVVATHEISFGAALELSVIMPLSWLPLIADYTRFAARKKSGLAGSFLGYFLGSSLMYTIGLAIALYEKDASVGSMMMSLHLGGAALMIVLLSTVTTTFLDAYSAGVTLHTIVPFLSEKALALALTLIGLGVALLTPIEAYEDFLYAIGSVFGPLFAIVISDYFLFKNRHIDEALNLQVGFMLVWVAGVALYYQFLNLDLIFGSTLPTMFVTALMFILLRKGIEKWTLKSR